jgi:hypothetical protein
VASCKPCPAGTFGSDVGLAACRACEGSSNAQLGSASCQCLGLNRVYLREVGSCVCISGYAPSDGSPPDEDSEVDCQRRVYTRCAADQALDSNGVCRAATDCADECDGAPGTREAGLGVCRCENAVTAKEVCDSACRARLPRVTFSAVGDIAVAEEAGGAVKRFPASALAGLGGGARCRLRDQSDCRILTVSMDPLAGGFVSDFQAPAVLGLDAIALRSSLSGRSGEGRGLAAQGNRSLAEEVSQLAPIARAIHNPVVCAGAGSALMFQGLTREHYPVYQKDSLLNTNDAFDFGAFELLADRLREEDSAPSSFLFLFAEPGIYVFRDAGNAARETVVAVMGAGGACPASVMYEAQSYASLLQVGAHQKAVSLSPDWTLFLASCVGFLVVILLTAVTVSHIYNKNWDQDPARKSVLYQMKQYSKLVRSDIEDPKALVSINSEASAFQFRRQGATESVSAAESPDGAGAAKPKRAREARTLDLGELERLKEGLDQQVAEMRKLYSQDEHLELSDDEGGPGPDVTGQIQHLRRLIESNRAMLAGERGEDSDVGSDGSGGEASEAAGEAEERERQRQAEEEAGHEAAARKHELEEAQASKLREGVNEAVLGDFAEKAEELQEKLRRMGSTGVEVDSEKLMAEIGAGCEEMGRALEADKARQQELLRKRMEARRRKRAKLQGDLATVEDGIQQQQSELKGRKAAIEERHQKTFEQKCT